MQHEIKEGNETFIVKKVPKVKKIFTAIFLCAVFIILLIVAFFTGNLLTAWLFGESHSVFLKLLVGGCAWLLLGIILVVAHSLWEIIDFKLSR